MHIVVIGNGITGITAARNIRKLSDHRITVISKESDHFFSRTALMYIYMGHMKYENTKPYEDWFWKKNRIDLVKSTVNMINSGKKAVELESGSHIEYDKLILATGSVYNKFDWPGVELKGVQGLYSLQDLEQMEVNTKSVKQAVVVGGGLIGIEMVEMLRSRNMEVSYLVREMKYWKNVLPHEESALIERHIKEHHVDLQLQTELKEIIGGENGRVRAVITSKDEEIPCQFVGLTVGVRPNIDFLQGSAIQTDKGILVNEFLETNVADIYAAGDCAQFRKPLSHRTPIEQVWYTGRLQGETVAQTVCGERTNYLRNKCWFNSAKLFDIEYQTYSKHMVLPKDGLDHVYWEHPHGKACIRITFETGSNAVIGFNLLGIRYRQEVCERWIMEEREIDYVIDHLAEANFDPEFSNRYEDEVRQIFKQKGIGVQMNAN